MEDCPSRQRNLVATTGTLPAPEVHQVIGASVPTARTHEAIRPAAGGQVLLASLFAGELRLEFAQGFRKRRPRHPHYTTAWGWLKQPDKQKIPSYNFESVNQHRGGKPAHRMAPLPAGSVGER